MTLTITMISRTIKYSVLLLTSILLPVSVQAEKQVPQYEWRRVTIPDLEYMQDTKENLERRCSEGEFNGCWFLGDYPQQSEADELCNNLVQELTNYIYPENKKDAEICARYTVLNYKEFKNPEWKPLDSVEYKTLLFELRRYSAIGKNYFKGIMDKTDVGYIPESEAMTWDSVTRSIKFGVQLYYWQLPMPKKMTLQREQTPLDLLTVQYPLNDSQRTDLKKRCPNLPIDKWTKSGGATHLVSHDLKGPDPRTIKPYLMDGQFHQRYKNNFYNITAGEYVEGGDGVVIGSFDLRATYAPGSFCKIIYVPINSGL